MIEPEKYIPPKFNVDTITVKNKKFKIEFVAGGSYERCYGCYFDSRHKQKGFDCPRNLMLDGKPITHEVPNCIVESDQGNIAIRFKEI